MFDHKSQRMCEIKIGIKPNFDQFKIRIPLHMPSCINAAELAYRICLLHNIPISLHGALEKELKRVINEENEKFFSSEDAKQIDGLKTGSLDIKSISAFWEDKYYWSSSNDFSPSPSDNLPSLYHSLVHSPSVSSLVSLEHSYSDNVSQLVDKKEKAMRELSQSQSGEMESAVESVGSTLSAEDVTCLASSHAERNQMEEVTWDSKLTALKEEQRRSFQSFVREAGRGREIGTPVTPKEFVEAKPGSKSSVPLSAPIKEESFTIHLGTQMKQMHNLRIMATDVESMCTYSRSDDSSYIPPQRFQTAMNLYSHNLSGLVLLVDDRVNTYTGMKNEFGNICNRSPELHFSDFEGQLEKVRSFVPQLAEWRNKHLSVNETDAPSSVPTSVQSPKALKMGDVYISKHSNLAEVHTVFHLVVDDSLRSSDINSRHSVIMGLRNVLKVSCLADITTLTVPLLLTHKLTEEMTIPWCQKRAELVFKCLKGFMIEMSSWGGAEMKNLQFLVPKGISDDLFQTLCSMLQSIFRLSNTLVVKTKGN